MSVEDSSLMEEHEPIDDDLLGEANEPVWQPRASGDISHQLVALLALPRSQDEPSVLLHDRRTEDGLIVEEFSFESEPGETVSGMLAKPEDVTYPLPAVLCLHDLHQGRKTVMGESFYYDTRLNWLRGWGREVARQGLLAATITQRTFGKRPGQLETLSKVELLYGRPMMGAFVWEALQTLETLARRDDVDSRRLGIVGYGLGGIVGLYTAALDDRVKALVTACGGVGSLDLFAHWADPKAQDLSYFVPGILDKMDHPEIIASLVPRAYLLMARDSDERMPVEGVRRAEWEGGSSYRALAVEERFKVSIRPGTHDFTTEELEEAADWLTRWLAEDALRAYSIPDHPDATNGED